MFCTREKVLYCKYQQVQSIIQSKSTTRTWNLCVDDTNSKKDKLARVCGLPHIKRSLVIPQSNKSKYCTTKTQRVR